VLGVYAAPTPVEADEEAEAEDVAPKAELDIGWMMEHCKQVLRLLPGGLHVVGFLINSSPDLQSKYESKIRKLLSGAQTLDPNVEEPFLLYTKSNKLTSLIGSELKKFDAKVHDVSLEFVQLDTHLVLDCPVALHCDQDSDRMLISHAERAIEKLERTLASSYCIVDNKVLPPDSLVSPSQLETHKKKGGKSKSLDDTLDSEDGEILKLPITVLVKDELNCPESVLIQENNIRLKLLGRMTCRCYVPAGTSVQQCRQYFIQDAKRSIRGRIQMHCDSLVGEEVEGGSEPVVHEPPRRVFTRLPGTEGICISDYLYPGEGPEDSIQSIKEIFGFTPCEEDIEDDLEIVAAAKDVKRDMENKTEKKSFLGSGQQVLISVTVAAISAGLAWFRLRGNNPDSEDTADM